MPACKNCGSDETYTTHGETVCSNCWAVIDRSVIVSEVQFQENAFGVSNVVGQFISYEGSEMFGRDSRRTTLLNAKARIKNIADRLSMGGRFVDMAFKLYKLALSKGLTRGRRSNHVAAACLYIVCRMERKPYMLLDFSDKLEVDVYTLGHTYVQLSNELYISIPALDPCLYIERYASKLEFGDKTMDICKTANRLVARMDRDWMALGRRPSGICGAALLVAARIFNFSRTIKDIIKVVRIGPRTIRNRLNEFEKTPSSRLTVKEFHSITLEGSMDPPCYQRARKTEEEKPEAEGEMSTILEEVEVLRAELEEEIKEITQKKFRRFKKFRRDADAAETKSFCSTAPSLEELKDEMAQYNHLFAEGEKPPVVIPIISLSDGNSDDDNLEKSAEISAKENAVRPISSRPMISRKEFSSSGDNKDDNDDGLEVEGLVAMELEGILNRSFNEGGRRKSEAQLGLKESIEDCLGPDCEVVEEHQTAEDSEEELDLTGINDEELNEEILTEEEVRIKTVLWIRENAQYLEEMKAKEEKKAKELLKKPQISKKRRRLRGPRGEAATASEAIRRIIRSKRLSNKINYNALVAFNIGTIKTDNNNINDDDNLEVEKEDKNICGMESDLRANQGGSGSELMDDLHAERRPSLPERKIKIDVLEGDSTLDKKKDMTPSEDDDDHYFFDKGDSDLCQSDQEENNEDDCELSDTCYFDSD